MQEAVVGTVTQKPPESNTRQVNQTKVMEAKDEVKDIVKEGTVTKYIVDKGDLPTKWHTRN